MKLGAGESPGPQLLLDMAVVAAFLDMASATFWAGAHLEDVVAVDGGPGRYASHSQAVVPRRDDAGHRRSVVFIGIVNVGRIVQIVVIEGGIDVRAQVLVLVMEPDVDHRHGHAGSQGPGVPDILDVDVPPRAAGELPGIGKVPLASEKGVVDAGAGGDAGTAVYEG